MINLSTELVNDKTVQKFVRECPERFTDAMETAMNKATQRIRYLVKKETPNKWGIKKEEMKNFHLKRAMRSHGELVAAAILQGQNVALFKFQNVAPRGPMTGKTTGGVSVMFAGRNLSFQQGIFIAKMKNPTGEDHIGIYRRLWDEHTIRQGKRGPIKREKLSELTTVAATGMTASEKTGIPDKIAPMIQEEFENQFIKEAKSWLSVLGAK